MKRLWNAAFEAFKRGIARARNARRNRLGAKLSIVKGQITQCRCVIVHAESSVAFRYARAYLKDLERQRDNIERKLAA